MTGFSLGSKRLQNIEKEIDQVKTCRHPNLLQVFGAQTIADTSTDTSRLEIALAPFGSTLEDMLLAVGSLTGDRLLFVLQDVAQGLEALHARSLCHKCLHPRIVALASRAPIKNNSNINRATGLQQPRWLLTGCAYQQSLVDLNRTMPFTVFNVPLPEVPPSWQAPEVLNDPLSYTPARDIWDFGVLIASLLSGGQPYSSWHDPMAFIKQGLFQSRMLL